jgi:hypothetical protein
MDINFNSRETYLKWRKEWKLAYYNLSLDIREAKQKRKPANAHDWSNWASKAHYLRLEARGMLETLKEAKVEAQRQYLATKEIAA